MNDWILIEIANKKNAFTMDSENRDVSGQTGSHNYTGYPAIGAPSVELGSPVEASGGYPNGTE